MRPRRSLIAHVAWVMIFIILMATISVGVLAARLSSQGVTEIAQMEMQEALSQAEALLFAYHEGSTTREELSRQVNPAFRPGEWYLQLQDASGAVIAETEGAAEWFEGNAAQEQRIVMMDELGQMMVRSIAGIDIQNIHTQPVLQEGEPIGVIHVGRRMTGLEDKSTQFSRRILLLILGLLLLFAAFLFMLGRWVVIPAYRLIGASRAMAAGDFSVRADESVPGEMGYLSLVFNNMARELRRTFEDLKYEKSSMVLVLEGLSEGILAIDQQGEVIHRNQTLRTLLRGKPEYVEQLMFQMLEESYRDGKDRARQFRIGATCLEVLTSPILPPEADAPLGAVALVRDVTEQQKLEQTRHDYVANITHELRTPLATMRGLMEPLAEGIVEAPEDQKRYYDIVLTEIMRLSRLVNDLLELSGLQTGRASIEMEPVDVPELLEEVQERFAKAYEEKGVELTVELPEGAVFVRANEDRLSQVLTILMDNALKYTLPGGSARLFVEQQGDKLRFSVVDTGLGIAPDHLPYLFDRFYQADRSRSERGNGLGLSIAQEVLGKMGLALSVESEQGKGSRFFFDVPLEKE